MANVIGSGIARTLIDSDGDPLELQPASFSAVATNKLDTVDSTAWTTFPSMAGKEAMITSHPDNVDEFEISGDGDESAGMILKPTDHVSMPITNTNKLEYRKIAHTITNQYLLIIVLS